MSFLVPQIELELLTSISVYCILHFTYILLIAFFSSNRLVFSLDISDLNV